MMMADLVTVCNKVDPGSSVTLPMKFYLYSTVNLG